jgi:hypothetical protein
MQYSVSSNQYSVISNQYPVFIEPDGPFDPGVAQHTGVKNCSRQFCRGKRTVGSRQFPVGSFQSQVNSWRYSVSSMKYEVFSNQYPVFIEPDGPFDPGVAQHTGVNKLLHGNLAGVKGQWAVGSGQFSVGSRRFPVSSRRFQYSVFSGSFRPRGCAAQTGEVLSRSREQIANGNLAGAKGQ